MQKNKETIECIKSAENVNIFGGTIQKSVSCKKNKHWAIMSHSEVLAKIMGGLKLPIILSNLGVKIESERELNPKYALENLLRTQITSKQDTSLIYKTSP